MKPTKSDLQTLKTQLGRQPRGLLKIETRCPLGHPQTIAVYPLLTDSHYPEPFPTTFWLTCPVLIEQISELEHKGILQKLEKKVAKNPGFRANLFANHRAYLAERWSILTQGDRNWLRVQNWHPSYQNCGIGGIANWNHLKCLHLHFAHHQARYNVVGKYLAATYPITACSNNR